MRKELISLLLLFWVIFFAVSLFSFHAQDPAIGNDPLIVPDTIHNLFGLVGAHVAGLFVFLFGMGAFWIPVVLSLITLWYIKEKSSRVMWLTPAGGFLLMICTGAGFFLFRDVYAFSGTLVPAGGWIGRTVAGFLLTYTNATGCMIILVFFAVIGFIFATGLSMVTLGRIVSQKITMLAAVMIRELKKISGYLGQGIEQVKSRWESHRMESKTHSMTVDAPTALIPNHPQSNQFEITANPSHRNALAGSEEAGGPDAAGDPDDNGAIDLDDVFAPTIVAPQIDTTEYVSDSRLADIRQPEAFKLPSIHFLEEKVKIRREIDTDKLQQKARILETKLNDFNVKGEVVEILPGPVITTFEYRPAPGIKLSKITGLSDDLALALSAVSIRIVAPIPGRDVVGIEIPNEEREMVNLREMVASKDFTQSDSMLTLGLGKDLMGRPVITKMDKMPHLLIAGATGTGKSVGLNAMIISLLYKATPDEVKFIMIDPKRIELSVYNDIPHLISPVVTDMKKATNALFWAVKEMERRYELLEENGLRNLGQYNDMIRDHHQTRGDNPATGPEPDTEPDLLDLVPLPYIVVIVDELSDLMMVASKDVEFALTRLAQMARAAGIHIIIATQRPSADVLTGTIKANFPTRISFQVSSKIDGRIIMDQGGAESLLGNGDMLFCPPGTGKLMRIQGAYISETEIARITGFLKEQRTPEYDENVTKGDDEEEIREFDESDYDEKYDEAVAVVTQSGQASISYVQRRLRIGYNRAARLIEMMEHEGIIGPQIGTKPREILVKNYDEDGF